MNEKKDSSIMNNNDVSMAELSQGLSLKQQELLAYAILMTQEDKKTTFKKEDFQDEFEMSDYRNDDAYQDSQALISLQLRTEDFKNNMFSFVNVFSSVYYKDGLFTFDWNKDMIPHILELKEKYAIKDITVISNFKSSYSRVLYEYIKENYTEQYVELSRDELRELFTMEEKQSYKSSIARFKRNVLDVAIDEINKYTDLEVWYEEEKAANVITEFKIKWTFK